MKKTFKKFEPLNESAKSTVQLLLDRGGHVLVDRKEYIEIQRLESVAKVDRLGRVEWRPQS
jgi:hypothetical protein